MKKTFDIIGTGEGLSGLVACALLAGKGFACLWIDTSNREESGLVQKNIPSLITTGFWEQGLRQILGSLDTSIIETLRPNKIQLMQSIMPGKRVTIQPQDQYEDLVLPKKIQRRYLGVIGRSMTRPMSLAHAPWGFIPAIEPWERQFISGLSRAGDVSYITYLRYMASLMGMYKLDYQQIKDVLGSYLHIAKGEYVCNGKADLIYNKKEIKGVSVNGSTITSRYYMTEEPGLSYTPDGFIFYGRCKLESEVIPVGMGDLLVLSPGCDMDYPLVLSVERGHQTSVVSVVTKVKADNGLTSLLEKFSWASGMIMKRLREVIPFMDEFLVSFDAMDPFENNAIRPWFSFNENVRTPWIFPVKRYIKVVDRVYTCDRMKFARLDIEGEFLWGICLANEILKELNRSDLITKKMV
ncbi:MAG TPA: hypothetical protein ENN05_05220 [Deltaproteobacteria bacterium]|nr:hypothetical protein [Deltaproteobacteria bacterium]